MENRRLCNQEDRVFNERLKMVNAAKSAVPNLPRVRRNKVENMSLPTKQTTGAGTNTVGSDPLEDATGNAATSTEPQGGPPMPINLNDRQSLNF